MAELPGWLVELLAAREHSNITTLTPELLAECATAAEALLPGDRAELEQEARERVKRARRGLAELPPSEGNGRRDKFYGYAMSLGECVGAGVLDVDAARKVLREAAERIGRDSGRDIERGLSAGIAVPLCPEPLCLGLSAAHTNIGSTTTRPEPQSGGSHPREG